jgi:nitronate monooxygenase
MKKSRLSRRGFIKASAALGVGMAASPNAAVAQAPDGTDRTQTVDILNKSEALKSRFGLKDPIFQAAPGGEALAIAVANSGAMGAVSLTWSTPTHTFDLIQRMNEATAGNYYANFVLHFEPASLDKALEAGCPHFQFSWGIPDQETVRKIRSAGAGLGIQVSSGPNAVLALEHEPDYLICQGLEAGGHVQATAELGPSLTSVLEIAGDVPVLAAGGISNGQDLRRIMEQGASGAVLGTRLMATRESDAHDVYKESLLEADDESTTYTICFNRDWNAMHRVLRNSTTRDWEAEGCPNMGSKPGEDDVVADHPEFGPAMRYETIPPMIGHEGSLDEMAMYAGQGVGDVNDLPTARELIERIWTEFEDA